MEGTEERTNEQEDRTVKITQYDQPTENILKKKTKINKQKTKQLPQQKNKPQKRFRGQWNYKKISNIYVIRILEWEKEEGGAAKALQVSDKFPNLTRDIN